MRLLTLLFVLATTPFFLAQEKVYFSTPENLLKAVIPNENIGFWKIIYNEYARDKVISENGSEADYLPQFKGFKLRENQEGFYYIVYSKAGETHYITDKEAFKKFIGTPDNPEEAALFGVLEGYFFDPEYKEFAGNHYYEDGQNYIVELAKLSSEKCPLQRLHYTLKINKNSGEIVEAINNGKYFEVYDKTCENNPHYTALKKQMQEAEEKAEQTRLENKERVKQQRKKQLRSMRRD